MTDASDNSLYWVAKQTNAAGQVTDEITGNGVETVSTRNNPTGWLTGSTTTALADNSTLIQKWTNSFDEAGNLLSRARSEPSNMADSTETFTYDALDRLTSAKVKTAGYDATEDYAYDNIGNLTQKGGKSYTYTGCTTGGGPHAVCTVDNGTPYSYDPNGNMVIGNGRTVAYNPFNKVSHIVGTLNAPGGSSPTVDFMYGADGNRVVQRTGTTAGDETARTVYVGMGGTGKSMYERTTITTGSSVEHVHFLYAGGVHGGNAFALLVKTETPLSSGSGSTSSDPSPSLTTTVRYQHFDHLGSVTASTDENGRVVGTSGGAETTVFGYDAWGARRSPDGRPATGFLDLQVGHREFTGHETIPGVGLVNMNGRVYDPDLGRFLSPDPNVQFVADLQTYNRYTYAANNPLRYTDPTGYFFNGAFDFFVEAAIAVVGMVACAYTAGAGCALAFSLMAATYSTASAINNGAGWGNAIGVGLLQLGVGVVAGGFAGGALAGPVVAPLSSQLIAGACAGAASAVFMAPLSRGGWKDLGENILAGAAQGAAGAALGYAIQSSIVSQSSAAEVGGGGGSGEAQVRSRVVQRVFVGDSIETGAEEVMTPPGKSYSDQIDDLVADCLKSYNPADSTTQGPGLSNRQIAGIIFNETQSFSDLPGSPGQLAQGRDDVAHAIINGDVREVQTGKTRPLSAVDSVPAKLQQSAAYGLCVDAVNQARTEDAFGDDPTRGSIHFNFRNATQQNLGGPFQGSPLTTQVGPIGNSYSLKGLGPVVYIDTYR